MAFDFAANATDPAPISCNISISSGVNITSWNTATYGSQTDGYGSHGNPNTVHNLEPSLTHVWEIHEQNGLHWGPMRGLGQTTFLGEPHSMVGMGRVDFAYDTTNLLRRLRVKKATGCVMNPCLRQYSVKTSAGLTSVRTLKTYPGVVAIVNYNDKDLPRGSTLQRLAQLLAGVSNYTLISDEDVAINDPLLSPPANVTYCANGNIFSTCKIDTEYIVCQDEASKQAAVITSVLSGNLTSIYSIETRSSVPTLTANTAIQATSSAPDYSSYTFQQMVQYQGLNLTPHNIAESLTVMMHNVSTNPITGQVGHAKAFVHVRWPWLIYPAIVIFVGIGFVSYAIAETTKGRTYVWKNSSLPLIYHGLRNIQEDMRLQTMDMHSMEARAMETVVQLAGTSFKVD